VVTDYGSPAEEGLSTSPILRTELLFQGSISDKRRRSKNMPTTTAPKQMPAYPAPTQSSPRRSYTAIPTNDQEKRHGPRNEPSGLSLAFFRLSLKVSMHTENSAMS
jgi:hypothetical protein